jgi:hypothetical protein
MARRSALAGSHPAGGTKPGAGQGQNDPKNQNGQNVQPGRRRTGRGDKTTLTVAPDVLDEAKNGYWVAMQHGKHFTFAEYVTAALEAYNEAMRQELTKGKQFPQRPMNNLPTTHLS